MPNLTRNANESFLISIGQPVTVLDTGDLYIICADSMCYFATIQFTGDPKNSGNKELLNCKRGDGYGSI